MRGFVTAVRTLTVFPVPGRECESFSDSLFWFPVVGLLLGLIQVFTVYLVSLSGWNELAAAAGVFGGVILTRAIHADGLADVADGFWGGRTKDDMLRIMKDSSVGAFGVVALSAVLLLKWIAMVKLVQSGSFACIASGVLLARWVQVMLASSMSYARKEGGTAASFVNGAGWRHILVGSVLTAALLYMPYHNKPFIPVVLAAAASLAALLAGMTSYRRIGGVTGDVLGAGSEIAEVFVWTAGALLSFNHIFLAD